MMKDLDRPLTEITRTVWKCTLGLDVTPHPAPEGGAAGFPCRSTVTLDGAWCGSLSVSCPPELARSAAALFFGKPSADVSEAEMLDALGEIANMTGGNLKAVLPGPCRLSTPRSLSGPAAPPAPGSLRLHFACGARLFSVDLTQEDRP